MAWVELNAKYIKFENAARDNCVRVVPDPSGKFLWQYGKVVGCEATLYAAKDRVESFDECYSIPASKRWIDPLNPGYLRSCK